MGLHLPATDSLPALLCLPLQTYAGMDKAVKNTIPHHSLFEMTDMWLTPPCLPADLR